jgi:DNA-binding LytR/AlgR family response regulator
MENNLLVHIGGRKSVNPANILMLKADTNYTLIYLNDGSVFLSATTLGILEDRLKGLNFYRTHRSTLINLQYIADYKSNFNTNFIEGIFMKNNINIPVARRKLPDFLRVMQACEV